MIDLQFRGELPQSTRDELEQLTARVRGILRSEHNDDGTHGDVTVTSLTVQNAAVGAITALPYDSARYFAEGSSVWTVQEADQLYFRASRIGQLVFVQFNLQETAITTDTSGSLYIRMPEFHAIPARNSGGSPSYQVGGVLEWQDNQAGTSGMGQVSALAQDFSNAVPSTLLQLDRARDATSASSMFSAWPITNNLWIAGSCWFVVEPNNDAVPYFGS